jgi:hypothetical protein
MDKELETLRDLYAGMAMLGLVIAKSYSRRDHLAIIAFEFADSMLEARTTKEGIVSVKSSVPEGK